ncbi:oxidoreductase [Rhodoplanes elegans]|uniref:Oxidoreductase n=1 Tax=Rhodoplanes elegans TaxID=29408 RepID=A0A327JWB5_9BRAD|nr:SDR family oxidoreductase [Rhodoplanes elegans]MBK5960389.1 oxidoreductase [Rhodoplanes elegans]RAI29875.1 oxidoreductase [Rhodoplanes elegans]
MTDSPTSGKTMILTGGTGGIGQAIARRAAADGWAIGFSYASDDAAAATLVAELEAAGARAIGIRGDIADEAQVETLFDAVEAALGPPTALVNNAGITGPIGTFLAATPAVMRRVVDVNLIGTMLCTQRAVRDWTTRSTAGAVVNISSIAAVLGAPNEYVPYAAAKAGVETFTIGLGKELGPTGIRINAVCPGTIQTGIHAKAGEPGRPARVVARVPMGRIGEPDEIATAVLWLLSDEASYVTGTVLKVAGGL